MITESQWPEVQAALAYVGGILGSRYPKADLEDLLSYIKSKMLAYWQPGKASAKTFAVRLRSQAESELQRSKLPVSISSETAETWKGLGHNLSEAFTANSLQAPIGPNVYNQDQDGEAITLEDTLAAVQEGVDMQAQAMMQATDLIDAVVRLSQREQAVIQSRVYEGLTLREVSETLGVSLERVRQIENAALGKLRKTVHRFD